MLTQDQFARVVRSAADAKKAAATNELAMLNDRAWTQLKVGSCHAMLVARFERMSDAERNHAARLAGQPGREGQAEQARVRAVALNATAQRHRTASETRQAAGQQLLAEARTMAAGAGNPTGRGGGNPGPTAAVVVAEGAEVTAEGVEGVQHEPAHRARRRFGPTEADE